MRECSATKRSSKLLPAPWLLPPSDKTPKLVFYCFLAGRDEGRSFKLTCQVAFKNLFLIVYKHELERLPDTLQVTPSVGLPTVQSLIHTCTTAVSLGVKVVNQAKLCGEEK